MRSLIDKFSFTIVKVYIIYSYFKLPHQYSCLRSCLFAGKQLGQQGDSYEVDFTNIGDGATSSVSHNTSIYRSTSSFIVNIVTTIDNINIIQYSMNRKNRAIGCWEGKRNSREPRQCSSSCGRWPRAATAGNVIKISKIKKFLIRYGTVPYRRILKAESSIRTPHRGRINVKVAYRTVRSVRNINIHRRLTHHDIMWE